MYTLKYLFFSGLFVKVVVAGLVVMLAILFAMGLSKIKKIKYIEAYIKSFEEQFWSGIDLSNFYEANKENMSHPLGMIFKAIWEEWIANTVLQSQANAKADIKERMLNVAHVQKVNVMRTCETYIDALALFIKVAPFLGLLGTVLGMIDIFYNIDLENGITITTAGIGIGGSLICLVFALLVVIFAMPMFWYFNMKVQDISDKLDSFIVDLLHILGRTLDTVAVNGPLPSNSGARIAQQQVQSAPNNAKQAVMDEDDDV